MDNAKTPMDEGQAHKLMYKGNEDAWRFINGKWKTNDEGDIISPTLSHWSLVSHLAFNVEHAYGDCELSGQWRLIYAGGGTPEFVVRAMDSRRYYAVRFNLMMNLMTPLSRPFGPDMNRATVDNVERAGFEILEVDNLYLDVVKTIAARAPAS